MELRKRPRPRRVDPDFVSFASPSPPTPQRKRARRQAATKKPRVAAVKKLDADEPALRMRAKCAGVGIRSPLAGLQPSRCGRQVAPVSRVSHICRSRAPFNWYDRDIWTEVAKHLRGRDLLRLSFTCHWFHRLIADDSIWRHAFFRDLLLPTSIVNLYSPHPHHRYWRHLYFVAFDGSHGYRFSQREKYIDGFRIAGFLVDTSELLLTGTLAPVPRRTPPADDDVRASIERTGACFLTNARPGIWIADMNLVRCTVCKHKKCEGTVQVLDARHSELYLEEKFRDGTWVYEDLGDHFISTKVDSAAAAILNAGHHASGYSACVLDAKSWTRRPGDLQPIACFSPFAVALNSNLQDNHGLLSRFQSMRDMTRDGDIVSVRITQRLL